MGKLEIAKKQALFSPSRAQSVDDDLSPAFTIWHTGAPSMSAATATAVTAATITFDTGDDLTFTINGSADTRLGTNGKIDCSTETGTYDSLTEIYEKVNAVPGWCFRIEAGIGTDLVDNTTRNVVVKAATDCYQKAVTFYWDTSNSTTTSRIHAVISNRRLITMDNEERGKNKIALMEDEGGATNILDYISLKVNDGGTTPSGVLTIYSSDGRTDTLLAQQSIANNTAETYDFTKCGGITALPNQRLVARFVSTAGGADSAATITTYIVHGRSIGGRWQA